MLKNKILSSVGGEEKLYVDDVFSAFTYTGNGSILTINNGIDLAGKGGLVWIKNRDSSAEGNWLQDIARGATNRLESNTTSANTTGSSAVQSFLGNGFTTELNTHKYISWTFRRAPKFFDVVTYTGNGASSRAIAHSLGQEVGMVMIKATSTTGDWNTYHRSATGDMVLNTTAAQTGSKVLVNSATTSTFIVSGAANTNGVTYVAYLFAHDPSADGIIQCGAYTGNGSATGPIVNLGWEPQYLMIKNASVTGNWQIIDSMRGMPVGSADATLQANLSNAESSVDYISPTATGFQLTSTSGEVNTSAYTYIYLAIRRPNKPPTSGTQVYQGAALGITSAAGKISNSANFPVDMFWQGSINGEPRYTHSRLTGFHYIDPTNNSAEVTTDTDSWKYPVQDGIGYGSARDFTAKFAHQFRRAPGFFSQICYTGTGSNKTEVHDLTKAPSLMIVKSRSSANDWNVWCNGLLGTEKLVLNSTAAKITDATAWNSTTPTSSVISLGTAAGTNTNAATYVAYLFSNLAGIQSIGTYIGDGTSGRLINCGFTTGSRYVCIKAISTTGGWLVADSTRGITSGNDPYLFLNSTAAEVTTEDWLDPSLSGFLVNQTPASNANVNGVTYMYWSIA